MRGRVPLTIFMSTSTGCSESRLHKWRRPRWGAAFTCLVALVVWSTAEWTGVAGETGGCVLVESQGKVEIARKGSTEWILAATNAVLQAGDRIRTGLRARATLRWSELSAIRVNELTSLEIQPPAKD